jgi:hypothetical protein
MDAQATPMRVPPVVATGIVDQLNGGGGIASVASAVARAVLDPNVLVSAIISRRGGAPDRIVRAWREGTFELVISPRLIAELADLLARPKLALQAGGGRSDADIAALAGDAIEIDDSPDPPAVSPDRRNDDLIVRARRARTRSSRVKAT